MILETGIRARARRVNEWLKGSTLESALAAIASIPPDKALKPLFSCLCSCDQTVKWRAVSAMGRTVAALAADSMEDARVVVRRFMWMLNDESGGIGWGVPEAMAEVMACHHGLAGEYAHILVSFMREDGFYLELEALQKGLMWGVARLAEVESDLLREKQAGRYLLPYLHASDPVIQGLACLAFGRMGDRQALSALPPLFGDSRPLTHYQGGNFIVSTVGVLARQAHTLLSL